VKAEAGASIDAPSRILCLAGQLPRPIDHQRARLTVGPASSTEPEPSPNKHDFSRSIQDIEVPPRLLRPNRQQHDDPVRRPTLSRHTGVFSRALYPRSDVGPGRIAPHAASPRTHQPVHLCRVVDGALSVFGRSGSIERERTEAIRYRGEEIGIGRAFVGGKRAQARAVTPVGYGHCVSRQTGGPGRARHLRRYVAARPYRGRPAGQSSWPRHLRP